MKFFFITLGFISLVTILQILIANVVSFEDTGLFYPQLLMVKGPVRPPSISSIHIFNRLRSEMTNRFGPERRMFFPFNRIVFSMVAPRLMRFQFDMMLHSLISEIVKKVVIPILGSITGNDNIMRPPNLLSNILSPQITPQLTSQITPQIPSPAFDLKQMIENTQNAIQQQGLSLQNAIRMNGQSTTQTSPQSIGNLNQVQSEQYGISLNPHTNQFTNFASLSQLNNLAQHLQNIQQNSQQLQNINSMESLIGNGQQMHSNQMSFLPNVQTNFASDETPLKQQKPNINQLKAKNNINEQIKKQTVKPVPQFHIKLFQTNNSNTEEGSMAEVPTKEIESQEFQLNYEDTAEPNYEIQVSTEQINVFPKEDENQEISNHQISSNKAKTDQKMNEELERASRWNDILINMDKYKSKRRSIKYLKQYK
jgi:hypothetical protein